VARIAIRSLTCPAGYVIVLLDVLLVPELKLFAPPWAVPFTIVSTLAVLAAENVQIVLTDAARLMLNVHSAHDPAWPLRTTDVPETVAPEYAASEPLIKRLPSTTVARSFAPSESWSPVAISRLQPAKRSAIDKPINSAAEIVFLFMLFPRIPS